MKSRRERRKLERLAKKSRKNDFYMRKRSGLNKNIEHDSVINIGNEKAVGNKEIESKRKRERRKSAKKRLTVEDVRKLHMKEELIEDEKTIRRLEKQLKFRNKKKKIPKSFYDDGLGYVLEVIEQPEENLSEKKKVYDKLNKIKGNKGAAPQNMSDGDKSDNEEFIELDSDSAEGNAEIDMEEDENNSKSEKNHDDNYSDIGDADNEKYGDNFSSVSDEEEESKVWEDIYGRLRDKEGNIIEQESFSTDKNSKYIPPAKRVTLNTAENSQKQVVLKKIHCQLKGLLNRLSEGNIQPISSQIEEIYTKNSRNDVNETLSSLILNSIVSPVQTPERLVMEHAMLIALLHANIGEEIGAHFLQVIVCKLDELFKDGKYYNEGKMSDNVICLIAHIYAFKVVSSVLMYDILRKLYDGFQEKDIELILLILRNVGFALRKDDPLALKQLILDIQKKAAEIPAQQDKNRVNFMLETLTAIRNNNMYKISNYDPSLSEHMRKLLRGLIHKGHYIQEMRISYNDFVKANKGGGRWWIVGSAWNKEEKEAESSSVSQAPVDTDQYSEDLLKLAKAYRMNTDVRKKIFCIVASAEDYLDAFNRLMHLGLKNAQYREIVVVILDCCLQECTFNPYYAVLIEKFCKFDRKYRMTFQCAVWDKMKCLNEIPKTQRNNLADLLVRSFISDALNLTVLKVMSFADLEVNMVKFLRRIFRKLLLLHSEKECQNIFKKIPKDQKTFKASIRLFIIMFLDDKKDVLQNKLSFLQPRNKDF